MNDTMTEYNGMEQNNNATNTTNFKLPEDLTVIGVGGCGKTLLNSISKHNWFLKHYLSTNGSQLGLYTLDTATNERDDDETNISLIEERIDGIVKKEFGNRGASGVVNCRHFDLSEMASIQNIPDLTSARVVQRLQRDDDNPVWWLHDPEHGINFNDLAQFDPRIKSGFGGGVYRMRAVSKAAFTIAVTTQATEFTEILSSRSGAAAIIVGLGGGTGSGMFIDLAKRIRKSSPNKEIFLFAVLPASSEKDDEHLNAAVALTELEYLNVTGKGLFNHVILTTLEKTGFTTIEAARAIQAVSDFSDAFPYLFVNTFASSKDGVLLSETLSYGGFINADASTIEYPIDKLRKFERDYDTYLDALVEITSERQEICQYVEDFFNNGKDNYSSEYGEADEGQVINFDNVTRYRDDILWIKDIWRSKGAEILQLKTPVTIEKIVEEYLDGADPANLTFVNLKRYVATIRDQMDEMRGTINSWSDRDIVLFDCIRDNLALLEIIGKYHTETTRLHEPLSQKAHMAVMCVDGGTADKTLVSIKKRLVEISEEIGTTTKSIETLSNKIEAANSFVDSLNAKKVEVEKDVNGCNDAVRELNSQKASIDSRAEQVKSSIDEAISHVTKDIQDYCEHDSARARWEGFEEEYISALKSKCVAFTTLLSDASTSKGKVSEIDIKKRYEVFTLIPDSTYIESTMKSENDFTEDLKTLDCQVSDYYYWKHRRIVAEKGGFFSKGDVPKIDKKITEAFEKLKATCNDLNNKNKPKGATEIPKGFSYKWEDDTVIDINQALRPIISIFNRNSDDIIERIVSPLIPKFELLGDVNTLNNTIKKSDVVVSEIIEALRTIIFEILDKSNGWTEESLRLENEVKERIASILKGIDSEILVAVNDRQKIINEKGELTAQVDQNTAKKEYLTSIKETLLVESKDKRLLYKEAVENLKEPEASGTIGRDENRTYKSILGTPDPAVLPSLDLDSTLDNLGRTPAGKGDIERLTGLLNNRYRGLLDGAVLGMMALTVLSDNDSSQQWATKASALVISSPSSLFGKTLSDEDPKTRSSRLKLMMSQISGDMGHQGNCIPVLHGGAKPWECSLTFMVAGNYLENILGFHQGGKYRVRYEKSKDNILHHVLFMDKGQYITRDMISSQKAMEMAFMEQDSRDDIEYQIRNLYHTSTLQDAINKRKGL